MGVSVDDTVDPRSQIRTMLQGSHLAGVGMTYAMTHPGHRHLGDGSLVRLDIELGRYVGRLYGPDLTVRETVVGTHEHVNHRMREWL
jgi:hypothetical protein